MRSTCTGLRLRRASIATRRAWPRHVAGARSIGRRTMPAHARSCAALWCSQEKHAHVTTPALLLSASSHLETARANSRVGDLLPALHAAPAFGRVEPRLGRRGWRRTPAGGSRKRPLRRPRRSGRPQRPASPCTSGCSTSRPPSSAWYVRLSRSLCADTDR